MVQREFAEETLLKIYMQGGGGRMVKGNEFITSLKVTWLRRFIIFSDNDNWSSLSRINLSKMFSLGDQNSNQRFKKSVLENFLKSWVKYLRCYKIDSLVKVMYSPLWGNSQIYENKNHIINEWFNKGIRNVMNLIDEDGSMYEFQKLKDVYEIHGTYLEYLHLTNRMPILWRDMINENGTKTPHISIMCKLNVTFFYLICKRRGCRNIYEKLFQ